MMPPLRADPEKSRDTIGRKLLHHRLWCISLPGLALIMWLMACPSFSRVAWHRQESASQLGVLVQRLQAACMGASYVSESRVRVVKTMCKTLPFSMRV